MDFKNLKFQIFVPFVLIAICSSCATSSRKYSSSQAEWAERNQGNISDINHTLYFIGDAGNATSTENNSALKAMKVELKKSNKNSCVVFLGDNIYPDGMPKKDKKRRPLAEGHLDAQIDALEHNEGEVYFIPGNHDWSEVGIDGLVRQEKYIKEKLGKDAFLPKDGCPGPEIIELNENVVLAIIDSQWFLEDWDDHPNINEECEVKTRSDFIFEIRDAIRKYKDKYLIIAMHHPLVSYGRHGGFYPLKSHLFPLTEVKSGLVLPLPVVGSLFQVVKRNLGRPQDLNHPVYKDMISGIQSMASGFENIIFLSGHEHNQQLIYKEGHNYIVSGSGSKKSDVKMGPGSIFSSGNHGFGKLEIFDEGVVWVSFYEPDINDQPELVFRRVLNLNIPDQADFFPEEFPVYDAGKDSLSVSIYDEFADKNFIYNSLFGEHYRQLYSLEFKVPSFDLFDFKDGLRPVKRGGGSQTNSLRLELPDGNQYVIRAIRKDVEKLLPKGFAQTFATDFLKDQFTTAHPLAAFAIPGLAEAAGILHTHPQMFYVPKQPALGYFNEYFGNELYLFEERPAGNKSEVLNFGYSKNIISTPDLLKELDSDKEARVDQKAVLRARLFDIIINDWDRHDDQWRWAQFLEGGYEIYRPIPRDRDQAFSKFDGWVTGFLNKTLPVFRQMRSFDYDIPDVAAISHNARWFDRTFLNQLTWEDWEEVIAILQENLTKQAIEESIREWPKEVYELHGLEIEQKLLARVQDLRKYALEYYNFLNKHIDIPGTTNKDLFSISMEGSLLKIEVTAEKELKYSRIIDPKTTNEVRLFGKAGDDTFMINNSLTSGIKIFLIGGPGKDNFESSKPIRIQDDLTIRDNKEKNNIQLDQGKILLTNKPEYNTYNRKSFQYDYSLIFPNVGYNPDDGFLLGFNYSKVKNGFMKWPFSSKHTIAGKVGFTSKSYSFNYIGEFTSLAGHQDLVVNIDVFSPQYVTNFFGFGNETAITEQSKDYYRIRNRLGRLQLALRNRMKHGGAINYGILGEIRKLEFKENTIISESEEFVPFFSNQTFTGGFINYTFENVDVGHNPSRGIKFLSGVESKIRVASPRQRFMRLSSDLTFYQELLDARRVVLALRTGYYYQFGEVDFYQLVTLGGHDNLRGYRNQRFSGRSAFFFNSDLRIRLGQVNNYLMPFSYGFNVGFDYGRLWIKDGTSTDWHVGYGGGIWFSPFDVTTITVNHFTGSDEGRLTVGLGFFF